ncbi:Cyclic nucleotide-binding domain-containing protein 2 [Clydaea vesicula]|uniref:Cyclic nucleotide-binding domain-containing protein 2 n=1 Tax=Clydaea vesicula TaxID=447962 RepID=A0AAD5XYG9_9FUNG|nr:Cyclic nucleotide-binding domain-containing protein 2 [Clydaea vesicula]
MLKFAEGIPLDDDVDNTATIKVSRQRFTFSAPPKVAKKNFSTILEKPLLERPKTAAMLSAKEKELLTENINLQKVKVDAQQIFLKLQEIRNEKKETASEKIREINAAMKGNGLVKEETDWKTESNHDEVEDETFNRQTLLDVVNTYTYRNKKPDLNLYLKRAYSAPIKRTPVKNEKLKLINRPKSAPFPINSDAFMKHWIIKQGGKLRAQKYTLNEKKENCHFEFLPEIPDLFREGPPTLADWKNIKKFEEKIWNPDAFSLKQYFHNYALQNEDKKKGIHIHITKTNEDHTKLGANTFKSFSKDSVTSNTSSNVKLSAENEEINLKKLEKLHVLQILKKACFSRTESELDKLGKYLKKFNAFQKISEFILQQLCSVMILNTFDAGRAIFRQGEMGAAWYIILTGTVSVQITKTGRIEDSIVVSKLHEGDGFGELSLINEAPRAATITSDFRTELIRVEKHDYIRIMKFNHEKELKEKIYFLLRVPIFGEWTEASVKAIAQFATWRRYKIGEFILKEGQQITELFFIRKGNCDVFRRIIYLGRKDTVLIGKHYPDEYFGEERIIMDDDSVRSACTIVASKSKPAKGAKKKKKLENGTEVVEVLVFPIFNIKDKLKTFLVPSKFSGIETSDVIELKINKIKKNEWRKVKAEQIGKFIKESKKDPNITIKKLNLEVAFKKNHPLWKK